MHELFIFEKVFAFIQVNHKKKTKTKLHSKAYWWMSKNGCNDQGGFTAFNVKRPYVVQAPHLFLYKEVFFD